MANRGLRLVMLLLAGCGGTSGLREDSSGQIGCPTGDVEIVDHEGSVYTDTWTAICNGRTYFCSSRRAVYTRQVECHRSGDEEQPEPAATIADGCQYDTQCKGDRVCERGRCVDRHLGEPPQRDAIGDKQIARAMREVEGQVLACGARARFKVRVHVAPDGSVASVEAGPPLAGTPAASCIENAVGRASFDRADRGVVFSYTFTPR
jgi:hypothetical protein